jgi:hypothetical protein
MTTASPLYGTPTAMTIGLSTGPLASDTNLVAGRESTALDQKDTLDAIDVLVGGKVTTGTSPTASRQIEVWAYGSYDDTEFSGSATGSDANLTPGEKTCMRLLTIIPTVNTSDKAYKWGPFSIAQAFGGSVPVQFGVYVVHNTAVNLNSTSGNHEVVYTTVKYESA